MSTEEVNEPHTEGPPWEIMKRCATYTEANNHRNGLLAETDNFQVKVHLMGPANKQFFAVKARLDPALAEAEDARLKREEKKRRKARLNKKRRKK